VTMLAELVDVVIGVDTHKNTHTAAVVVSTTGAALEGASVGTDLDGYGDLVAMAARHSDLRAWSIEGAGGWGAGLARFLAERGERAIELDRPVRAARRNGAKSDALDAVRAGREALAREHLAQPRSEGERAALALLLTARRSAVDAARVSQQQLQAFVVTAPEVIRARFRGKTTKVMLNIAFQLRINPRWDLESRTYARVLRDLARRCRSLQAEASVHEKAIVEVIQSWRPDLLAESGVGPIVAATVLCACSHPGRVRHEGAFANLAGVAPIPASSGLTTRHRLN